MTDRLRAAIAELGPPRRVRARHRRGRGNTGVAWWDAQPNIRRRPSEDRHETRDGP